MDLNVTETNSLDTPVTRAFAKIFKTYNNNVLKWCMYYSNFLPAKYEIIFRKLKFLIKMQSIHNGCLETLSTFTLNTIADIIILYNFINVKDNFNLTRSHIAKLFFVSNLDLS